MRVERIGLRDFRTYERADVEVGPGLTIVHGANGSGKTNLLEGLYFGATARSFRTANERELVRFGAPALRVALSGADADGRHELAVGFAPGEPKRMTSDGAPIERLLDAPHRPLMSGLLSRPPRTGQGPRGAAPRPPRSVRRRAVARARGDSRRLPRGARTAQRPDRARARRPIDHGLARAVEPDPRARRCGARRGPPRCRRARRGSDRRARGRARPCRSGDRGLPRARPGGRRGRARRGHRRARWMPTSRAGTRPAGPTATISSSRGVAARCGATARRANSGSRCSPCCWPSATRLPTSATDRR